MKFELIVSIFSLVVSVIAFYSVRKQNMLNIESSAFSMVMSAQSAIAENLYDKDNSADVNSLIEIYLSNLNYASSLYFNKEINRKRFLSLFKSDIYNVFKLESFLKILNDNYDDFVYLRKMQAHIVEKDKR